MNWDECVRQSGSSAFNFTEFTELVEDFCEGQSAPKKPQPVDWMDWPPVLMFFGVMDVSDGSTDTILPAQVEVCQARFPETVDLYEDSWHFWGPVQSLIYNIHLSGLAIAFVGVAVLCQVVFASIALKKTMRVRESMQHFLSVQKENRGVDAMILAADDLAEKYSAVAEVADAVGMMNMAKYFQNAAADLMLELRDEDPVAQMAEKSKRKQIAFNAIFKKVLLEAVPCVYISIAFGGISFGHVSPITQVKIVLTALFSIATILQKAGKCFGLGLLANFVGGSFVVFACGYSVKLVMMCICPSHVFNLVGAYCFESDERV